MLEFMEGGEIRPNTVHHNTGKVITVKTRANTAIMYQFLNCVEVCERQCINL